MRWMSAFHRVRYGAKTFQLRAHPVDAGSGIQYQGRISSIIRAVLFFFGSEAPVGYKHFLGCPHELDQFDPYY